MRSSEKKMSCAQRVAPEERPIQSQKAELRELPPKCSILSSEFLIFLKYGQKLSVW
jgi:hypothetical protein